MCNVYCIMCDVYCIMYDVYCIIYDIKTLSIKGSIKLIFFRKGIKYVYNRLAFN